MDTSTGGCGKTTKVFSRLSAANSQEQTDENGFNGNAMVEIKN
jgi:hypothetical protein